MEINEKIKSFWPEWEIEEEIGRGSFGTVYRAVRCEFGNEFHSAIKVISIPGEDSDLRYLKKSGIEDRDLSTYFGEIVQDCANEISILERLKGHSNIVSIEDFKVIEAENRPAWEIYIRMEYLKSLEDYMTSLDDGADMRAEVIRMGIDLCEALKRCEQESIIHRDIKLSNVFVTRHNDFKLGDFGIAKTLERTHIVYSKKGTPNYMAPEVVKMEPYQADVDLYSLGILLYILMNNNRAPFLDQGVRINSYTEREEAFSRRVRGEKLPPPCNADRALAEVILRACEYRPENRFHSAEEFMSALEALRNEPGITEEPHHLPVQHTTKRCSVNPDGQSVDIVFCVDAGQRMAEFYRDLKAGMGSLYRRLSDSIKSKGRDIGQIRVRMIRFDHPVENPVKLTPAVGQMGFLRISGNHIPEFPDCPPLHGGENALREAMHSSWNKEGLYRRQVIVVCSDSVQSRIPRRTAYRSVLRSEEEFEELTEYWGDIYESGLMDQKGKRLLLFVPEKSGWEEYAACWDRVIAVRTGAGRGLSDIGIRMTAEEISKLI